MTIDNTPLPREVRSFLREANERIVRFQEEQTIPGFLPSDFVRIYRVLAAIAESDSANGSTFCEWGSGFGVVTCLASMLGFDAYGIECVESLTEEARRLAEDFDLPVEFVRGSFLPKGSESMIDHDRKYAALVVEEDEAYEELGLDLDEFAIVYAFPWPDEEAILADLFEHFASDGALLVQFRPEGGWIVQRKT